MKTATHQVGTPQRTTDGWTVPSTSGDQVYTVERNVWGRWTCSCDDWWYRRRKSGEACKHIAVTMAVELDGEEVLMGVD
jgi:hypothetical protein